MVWKVTLKNNFEVFIKFVQNFCKLALKYDAHTSYSCYWRVQNFVPGSKCFRCMYKTFVPDSKCFRCMYKTYVPDSKSLRCMYKILYMHLKPFTVRYKILYNAPHNISTCRVQSRQWRDSHPDQVCTKRVQPGK